jgi:hypothetical protein
VEAPKYGINVTKAELVGGFFDAYCLSCAKRNTSPLTTQAACYYLVFAYLAGDARYIQGRKAAWQ